MQNGNGYPKPKDMIEIFDGCAASLQTHGYATTAELLRIANLDLRCRLHGISVDELQRVTAIVGNYRGADFQESVVGVKSNEHDA